MITSRDQNQTQCCYGSPVAGLHSYRTAPWEPMERLLETDLSRIKSLLESTIFAQIFIRSNSFQKALGRFSLKCCPVSQSFADVTLFFKCFLMASKQRKLVLHIDVNNTMFVGDSKTKLTALEGVLNEYMTEIVWGRKNEEDEWVPVENPISSKPASENVISYYKYAEEKYQNAGKPRSEFKEHARQFTFEEIGKRFRPYVEKVKERLECDAPVVDGIIDPLILKEPHGIYYRIVPSFFKLITNLIEKGQEFSIILRTFGGDGETALQAVKLFIDGLHPVFGFPEGKSLDVSFTPYQITGCEEGLSVRTSDNKKLNCPEKVYVLFSEKAGVHLFLDDYEWWKKQGYVSSAGKPLLVDPTDSSIHHIMFDDNIRAWDPSDNIVNLMVRKEGKFQECDPKELDDVCLVRTQLFESVLDEDYFIEKVEMCQHNYQNYLQNANK
ncbi:uncharacterized protein LOC5506319 [Nematostella vectensis]|nr:uncharacterized protein LOC5506319 [Nematostella vectensis]